MSLPETTKDMILRKAREIRARQIQWRRHLHQHPELSDQEYETTKFLKDKVRAMGLKVVPLKMKSGLIAEAHGNNPGKTVAIRTDIDALPITEKTKLPYQSKADGIMHACGHDVHMAVALGTAAVISSLKKEFDGAVRFIFQPSEEMPPGGARPMIANGALKDVSMIFALHVDPHLHTGRISLRDGVAMGAVTDFNLVIHGKGGHAARPHDAVDAIAAAAEVIDSLQKVISREIDPIKPVVMTVGKIEGGTARNAICDRVELTATARALSQDAARKLRTLIKRTAESVCKARGAKAELMFVADYPVLRNHPLANRILADNFQSLFRGHRIEQTPQVLGGEDFACYLEKVKGAMFRLGTMNVKTGANKPWHSPQFKVDEDAMYYGTALMAASALDFLRNKSR
ncbi:MAG: M20 family metallopeptidase [Candidatus Zixiibacteriota bacterium]